MDGQRRYAHGAGLHTAMKSLPRYSGMNKIINDESLRCALVYLAPTPPKYGNEEEHATECATGNLNRSVFSGDKKI